MTAYTANLAITATTAWDTWYSYSDRACNDTATVYRWYVATFFSAKAQARYEWIGNMIGTLAALAILYTQRWAEAEVASCLFAEDEDYEIDFQQDYDIPDDIWNSNPDHIPGVGEMVEADPFAPTENQHYPAMAATIAAPVATLVVPVSSPLESMTTAQLRKMAIAHNQGLAKDDPRYIRNAARLTKAQALAALG